MVEHRPGEELARLSFPLGELEKPRVRELARSAGLPVADKRESQDLCFLAGTSGPEFMHRHGRNPSAEGEIVDRQGRVLGRHGGHHRFTVGQRGGHRPGCARAADVLSKDARRNRVVVGPKAELATRHVAAARSVPHRSSVERPIRAAALRGACIPCSVAGEQERMRIDLHRERRCAASRPDRLPHGRRPGGGVGTVADTPEGTGG